MRKIEVNGLPDDYQSVYFGDTGLKISYDPDLGARSSFMPDGRDEYDEKLAPRNMLQLLAGLSMLRDSVRSGELEEQHFPVEPLDFVTSSYNMPMFRCLQRMGMDIAPVEEYKNTCDAVVDLRGFASLPDEHPLVRKAKWAEGKLNIR